MVKKSNSPKRRNGEGYLRQRKDGRWELQYSINGKSGSFYGFSKDEVNKKYTILKHQLLVGGMNPLEKIKYGDWFEEWLNARSIALKPKTQQSYKELYDLYIKNSHLVGYFLQDLTPSILQNLISELQKKGLSSRTIRYTVSVIRASLKNAVLNNHIIKNPADGVSLPRKEEKEPRVLTIDEQMDFMKAISGNRYEFLFQFDLKTGLRTGELLGLQWKNIDFEKRTFCVKRTMVTIKDPKTKKLIHTYGSPKTKKSIRTIYFTEELGDSLRKQKEMQKLEMKRAGDFWLGMNEAQFDDNNVFLTDKGTPVYPSTLRHLIDRTIKKINQERTSKSPTPDSIVLTDHFSMHALRHTFATRALENHIPPKVVQEILGHSSITVTLDTYSHVLPNLLKDYMEQLEVDLETEFMKKKKKEFSED